MGTLFPEKPDYRSFPSPTVEAAKVVGPLFVITPLVLALDDHTHTHVETPDPMPPASRLVVIASTSASSGPLYLFDNDPNDAVMRRYNGRRVTGTRIAALSTSTFTMAPGVTV